MLFSSVIRFENYTLIMRFDWSVSENLRGDFCLKMVDSNAISGQIFLTLMLDGFPQRFLEVTAVLR